MTDKILLTKVESENCYKILTFSEHHYLVNKLVNKLVSI